MEKERVLYKAQVKANLEYEQAIDAGFYLFGIDGPSTLKKWLDAL